MKRHNKTILFLVLLFCSSLDAGPMVDNVRFYLTTNNPSADLNCDGIVNAKDLNIAKYTSCLEKGRMWGRTIEELGESVEVFICEAQYQQKQVTKFGNRWYWLDSHIRQWIDLLHELQKIRMEN